MNRPKHGFLGLVALAALAAAVLGLPSAAGARPAPSRGADPSAARGDHDRDARSQAGRHDDRRPEARPDDPRPEGRRDDRRPEAREDERRPEARRPARPRGAVAFRHGLADYHVARGKVYRWSHGAYVVTRAPLGAALDQLPAGFRLVRVAGKRYGVFGDLWLSWSAPLRSWVVVESPLVRPRGPRLACL